MDGLLDCVVIGGGPAGLTAAIYLARYRRKVVVYDTLNSRAEKIPLSHNYPGFPSGISGKDLLTRLRQQLSAYPIPILEEKVESIEKDEDRFILKTCRNLIHTRYVILCTGVIDIEPVVGDIRDGIQKGLIRHCPVCDAYEVIDKKIAVIGQGKAGLGEALFLRQYTSDVTLMTLGQKSIWTKGDLKKIHDANITVIDENLNAIELTSEIIKITFPNQRTFCFDSLYSALGCINNNKLAHDLNVKLKEGCIAVNPKQETSIKGMFAAGDIVSGLNQICVATGQAAIAAMTVHNRCRE